MVFHVLAKAGLKATHFNTLLAFIDTEFYNIMKNNQYKKAHSLCNIFGFHFNFIFSSIVTGKLERSAILKAICAGFKETTEPLICLTGGRFLILCLRTLSSSKSYMKSIWPFHFFNMPYGCPYLTIYLLIAYNN